MVRRAHVLSGRGAGRRLWPGTGGAVCLLLRAGQLRHGEHEPDQLHRGQSAGGVPSAAGGNGHRAGPAHRAGHTGRAEAGGRSYGGHRPAHGPVLPVRGADRGLCPLGGCPGGIRGHLPGGVWLAGRRGRGAGLRHGPGHQLGIQAGSLFQRSRTGRIGAGALRGQCGGACSAGNVGDVRGVCRYHGGLHHHGPCGTHQRPCGSGHRCGPDRCGGLRTGGAGLFHGVWGVRAAVHRGVGPAVCLFHYAGVEPLRHPGSGVSAGGACRRRI